MSDKQVHLQMIQAIINRMSTNSFLLKGWSVVLVSALFALGVAGSRIYFIYLAYFPTVAFWCLDGYFLRQDRLFRELYDHVRGIDEARIDFSMSTKTVAGRVAPWWKVAYSPTLSVFHGAVFGSVVVVMALTLVFTAKGT